MSGMSFGETCFAAPDQRLRIERHKIGVTRNDLIAKPDSLFCLIICQVLVGWAMHIIIPHAATYRVQHDPLKAMIIAHRPMHVRRLRKLWHYVFCQHHVARYQIGRARELG